jgi:uncharacterized protein YqfA (UPF0365 family)
MSRQEPTSQVWRGKGSSMLNPALLFVGLMFFAAFLFAAMLYRAVFRPWMRASASGVPVSPLEICGMQFRKADPKAVIDALILARQNDVEVSAAEMESAYLHGVDLEKMTLATIEAKRRRLPVSFQELVEYELEGNLAEKLKEPSDT